MNPSLAEHGYGVTLLGEALGEDEANEGKPFVGRAGFRLSRLIAWAGLDRARFDIVNSAWCRPPDNKLEGEIYELPAVAHCKAAHWGHLLYRSKVVVPMGNVALSALTGRKGILSTRGYLEDGNGFHILSTVHPSFIQRGQSKWSAAFINDLQKAVKVAREGIPPQVLSYSLDPSPAEAYAWAKSYRSWLDLNPGTYLAFDIETPGKDEDEDSNDPDEDAPDATWHIDRIGFSYQGLSAISFPWSPEYRAAISLLLGSPGSKVVWNAGFDVPRIRRAGTDIAGTIHDGMVAWHILHSDLPKRLGFVATFTCPYQPRWKHLSGSKPAFYNATDADVELRSMVEIEGELRRTGLWEVYQRDVLDLEPILVHMHQKGMPVDLEIRADRAGKLDEMLRETRVKMEASVPLGARRIEHVYKSTPKNTDGLQVREGTRLIRRCAVCGAERPRADHFKRTVKKFNPCADAGVRETEERVEEFYRLAEFAPSGLQLRHYHEVIGRPLPTVFDRKTRTRKVSFGERQIKDLTLKYPDDILYPLILQFRQLQKVAGTYIGYPAQETSKLSS